MQIVDSHHLGREKVIGCWEVDGVLVDPGPESTLETVLKALGEGFEPRAVLLTHIHFDHAGATGALVRRWPDLPVYVHVKGARHLADPERLVRSAAQLYGGDEGLARHWGEVVPVPQENLHPLEGGERVLDAFRVEYTPGHASHHVCFLHEATGMAFVGDVGGVRITPRELTVAPTPPPDIDVEAWKQSLSLVRAWSPAALGLTHYGLVEDVPAQLEAVERALEHQIRLQAELDQDGFIEALREHLRGECEEQYLQAAPADHLYLGLERWRRISSPA
jgi:glyoxylase-like metal-dependent hydrolase (beta-lactamase superfamily II)